MFEKASELAPDDPDVYHSLAWCRSQEARFAWCDEPERTLDLALEMAQKALALDHTNFENHWVLGHVCLLRRDYEGAVTEIQKALKLSPDVPNLLADMGDLLIYLGRPQDAVRMIEKAINLNPYHPDWYVGIMAQAYTDLEDHGAALQTYKEISATSHGYHLELADLYVRFGRLNDARFEVKKHLAIDPEISLKRYAKSYLTRHPYQDLEKAEDEFEQRLRNLRLAGVPE
jgi:tetratricopeptide (TPR) repeat protein